MQYRENALLEKHSDFQCLFFHCPYCAYFEKHPGGWETALVVVNVLKKKLLWRCGAVRILIAP